MTIVSIVIVIFIIAGVAGYYFTMPSTKLKETLVMGTTDSVETCLDQARILVLKLA